MRRYLFIFLLFMLWHCGEEEPKDCAGVTGGDNICGCTDSTAINYYSSATFDDGSCEYDSIIVFMGTLREFSF